MASGGIGAPKACRGVRASTGGTSTCLMHSQLHSSECQDDLM